MNYFFKMNVLWASRIALVLLLGLSGFNHAAAQCKYNWSACSSGKYIMVSYDCWDCYPSIPPGCLELLITKVYSAMTPGGRDVSDCASPYMVFWETSRNTFMFVPITQEVAGIGMKAVTAPKEVTAEEVSKLPGLSKFKPFAGGDKLNLRIKDQLLVSTGKNGSTNSPGLCDAAQSCGTAGQWTIKPTDAKKKGTYTIKQTGKANACLNYSSAEGLGIKTGTSSAGSCSEWVLSPDELGTDGEIKSYQIRPLAQPDHVLVLDSDSQQLQVVSDKKVTPDGKDATAKKEEPTKLKAWTINPASKTSAVNTTGQTQKKTATQK